MEVNISQSPPDMADATLEPAATAEPLASLPTDPLMGNLGGVTQIVKTNMTLRSRNT